MSRQVGRSCSTQGTVASLNESNSNVLDKVNCCSCMARRNFSSETRMAMIIRHEGYLAFAHLFLCAAAIRAHRPALAGWHSAFKWGGLFSF
jgi:hypothetical protein